MPTKLPQYVLPTFPAIALLCALAITSVVKTELPSKGLRCLQILWGLLSFGLAVALASLPVLLLHQETSLALIASAVVVFLSCLAVRFSWRGNYQKASLTIVLLALLSYPLIFAGLLPQLKPIWLSKSVAQLIDKKRISNEKPLLVVGFEEPSLVFNLNTSSVKFTDSQTAEQLIKGDSSRLAIIEAKQFELWQGQGNLAILAATQGYNYSKGRWLELFLVGEKKLGQS